MRKSILLVILCLFLVGVFVSIYNVSTVGADSGFDTSYDFGGSDWDSGSSWDSDSDSGGTVNLSLFFLSVIGCTSFCLYHVIADKILKIKKEKKYPIWYRIIYPILIFVIIFLIFDIIYLILSISAYLIIRFIIFMETITEKNNSAKLKPISDEKIIKLLGNDFNKEDFNKQAFNIYKDLQIAWMNFDYDKIKELVNDEMYNMYVSQLETLKIKNQQNIMSDIEFIEGYITDYKKVNNKEIFKVYMSVNCYDYIINTKNNITVRGNKNRKLTLSYILTFERNIEIVNYCPQCGADVKNLTECSYCKSKIVNNNSNLKMTKKEIKSQK